MAFRLRVLTTLLLKLLCILFDFTDLRMLFEQTKEQFRIPKIIFASVNSNDDKLINISPILKLISLS